MFAGVLDGGQDEVFLGGTRLKKFMDSVEQATGAIPQTPQAGADGGIPAALPDMVEAPAPATAATAAAMTAAPVAGIRQADEGRAPIRPSPAAPTSQTDALGQLLSFGADFLGRLGQAFKTAQQPSGQGGEPTASNDLIGRDGPSGTPYLKLPLPGSGELQTLADLLAAMTRIFPSGQQRP
jgi:hypothetical protein